MPVSDEHGCASCSLCEVAQVQAGVDEGVCRCVSLIYLFCLQELFLILQVCAFILIMQAPYSLAMHPPYLRISAGRNRFT